ncbi:MAG: hypothetical protein GKR77_02980 [Legionellales bacterium]|nr:hypothetical protein [Legionellales bacterium]
MLIALSQLIAIGLYSWLIVRSSGVLLGKWSTCGRRQQGILLLAVLSHWLVIGLALVYGHVSVEGYDAISLFVIVTGLVTLAILLLSQWQWLSIVAPLAALLAVIALSLIGWPQMQFDHYYLATKELLHVFLSVLTAVVLLLTAWQSLVVFGQELGLRYKWQLAWLHRLPPLQATEQQLFGLIVICFICLTGMLWSSLWLFIPWETTALLYKTVLTVMAWAIFAGLLIGRYWFGWRGQQAIRWTLGGVGLVLILFLVSYWGGV